jgi:hypothetical protein
MADPAASAPSSESLEVIRKFAETYAQRTGTYFCSDSGVTAVVLEGLAQEALGRPADAIDSYRTAVARGGAVDGAAERLAALERGSVAATAAQPQAPTRR